MSEPAPLNAMVPELSVTEFARSFAFYTEVLGFSVMYERPEEGFAVLEMGEAQLMLDAIDLGRTWVTGELEIPLGRGINLQVTVDAIQPIVDRLTAKDVPLFLPPEEHWYRRDDFEIGAFQFAVQDPDGYLLRFQQRIGTRPRTGG